LADPRTEQAERIPGHADRLAAWRGGCHGRTRGRGRRLAQVERFEHIAADHDAHPGSQRSRLPSTQAAPVDIDRIGAEVGEPATRRTALHPSLHARDVTIGIVQHEVIALGPPDGASGLGEFGLRRLGRRRAIDGKYADPDHLHEPSPMPEKSRRAPAREPGQPRFHHRQQEGLLP